MSCPTDCPACARFLRECEARELSAVAVTAVAQALAHGAGKYAPGHWQTVSRQAHLEAAQRHLAKALAGQTDEPHEALVVARMAMARGTR